MSLDAMKQALEALEAWNYLEDPKPDATVITALRAAIEKARQWQGLTDAEREQFRQWVHPDIIEAIELKLQEKNT